MTELETRLQIMADADVENDPNWQGSRITNLIHQSMIWVQNKLVKLGVNNWKVNTTTSALGTGTLFNQTCRTVTTMPSNVNWEIPLDGFAGTSYRRMAMPIELENFDFVTNNGVLKPDLENPVFVMIGQTPYIFPSTPDASLQIVYTRIPTAPTYNDNVNDLDMPTQYQHIVIDRVVMQIKSTVGVEQVKQAKLAEIDNYIAQKYQLEQGKQKSRVSIQ